MDATCSHAQREWDLDGWILKSFVSGGAQALKPLFPGSTPATDKGR